MTSRRVLAAAGLSLLNVGRASSLRRMLSTWMPARVKQKLRERLIRAASGGTLPPTSTAQAVKPPVARWLDPAYLQQGVDCVGYPRAEFGLGETVRSWARAFASVGYPFTVLDAGAEVPGRQQDRSTDAWLESHPRYPVSLFFVNPDLLERVTHRWPSADSYRIGYWLWELEGFPAEWRSAFDMVDEIWVPTMFVREAVMAATHKPVMLMPMPIEFPQPAPLPRGPLGLDHDAFVFLFSFDFYSYPERKNPWAVIEAFRGAFPRERHDVQLFIKTTNGEHAGDAFGHLLATAAADPRIVVRNGHLDRSGMYGLIASADAYISLHRAEGIGLGMAEAMFLGKPVIATGWSGNMDFMSVQDAKLVDYHFVPVPPDAYPHAAGQRWAAADIEQAAGYMRELADDRTAARALGDAAAARIRRQYAPSACAARALARLGAITRARTAAGAAPTQIPGPASGPSSGSPVDRKPAP